MKNLLALTIFSLAGCGGFNFQIDSRVVDPAFIPYFQQFVYEGQARSINLNYAALQKVSIQFDDRVSGSTLAKCVVDRGVLNIYVGPIAWGQASKAARELLINHELGHCILGRIAHTDTMITFQDYYGSLNTWQGPASLMNTYAIPASQYAINRTYYLNELFGSYDNSVLYYNGPSHFDASNY